MNKSDEIVAGLTGQQAKNLIAGVLDIAKRDGKIHLSYKEWVHLVEIVKLKG